MALASKLLRASQDGVSSRRTHSNQGKGRPCFLGKRASEHGAPPSGHIPPFLRTGPFGDFSPLMGTLEGNEGPGAELHGLNVYTSVSGELMPGAPIVPTPLYAQTLHCSCGQSEERPHARVALALPAEASAGETSSSWATTSSPTSKPRPRALPSRHQQVGAVGSARVFQAQVDKLYADQKVEGPR